MPPISKNAKDGTPNNLRPYISLGLDLQITGREAIGDCPFCNAEGKLSINVETGQGQCWSCRIGKVNPTKVGTGFNVKEFLRLLWEHASSVTSEADCEQLAKVRGLCRPRTLEAWGVRKSPVTGEWLVPGFGNDYKVHQLYRYHQLPPKRGADGRMVLGKYVLQPTAMGAGDGKLSHALAHAHGKDNNLAAAKTVYVCEKAWDGMALWEVLRQAKATDDGGYVFCAPAEGMLNTCTVIAPPGCNVWGDYWHRMLADKDVVLMYDSDHARKDANGRTVPSAGYTGMKRVSQLLTSSPKPPSSVRYVKWGPNGYDLKLPSGYDVRDYLMAAGPKLQDRVASLGTLLSKVEDIPTDWVGTAGQSSGRDKEGLGIHYCDDYKALQLAWRKSGIRWTGDLDYALSIMLAAVVSTKQHDDPIWVRVISPPSSGKSTLCMALATATQYVHTESTFTGIYSGYRGSEDQGGDKDYGLLPKIKDKTFIVKDGDTLLNSPNRGKLLADLRDIYDGSSSKHYGHGVSWRHDDIFTTMILSGTDSLRELDAAESGMRFVDAAIMDEIDSELEDEVAERAVNEAIRNVKVSANGKLESCIPPAMVTARQVTGGYVCYLRENASSLLNKVTVDRSVMDLCKSLGKFVAFFRARPSKKHDEKTGREFSPRLVKQYARLTVCLAAVLGQFHVTLDTEVVKRVRRSAMDTAGGKTLDLCRILFPRGETGLSLGMLALQWYKSDKAAWDYLKFLKVIKVVERYFPTGGRNSKWRLTEEISNLYREVVVDAADNREG